MKRILHVVSRDHPFSNAYPSYLRIGNILYPSVDDYMDEKMPHDNILRIYMMEEAVMQKFKQNYELGAYLVSTEYSHIITYPYDDDLHHEPTNPKGHTILGNILMNTRRYIAPYHIYTP